MITRDLVHLFYHNQMQINGGKNDGFAAWGDSGAHGDGPLRRDQSKNLGLWQIAREYTLCDNFFMAAFGGSYLNHQFLISGRTPEYFNAAETPAKKKIAVLEDGPQANAPGRGAGFAAVGAGRQAEVRQQRRDHAGRLRGQHDGAALPAELGAPGAGRRRRSMPTRRIRRPCRRRPTTPSATCCRARGRWAWYGGAWQAALDGRGEGTRPNFQFHHQPFNYFKQFAPGTEARAQTPARRRPGRQPDLEPFIADAVAGKLPAVSFYKPQGNLNLHAGYSDIESGDAHVANVIEHLKKSPQWKDMVVVITFDENGGWWDHVAPPLGYHEMTPIQAASLPLGAGRAAT
jgi:acid phosphatase